MTYYNSMLLMLRINIQVLSLTVTSEDIWHMFVNAVVPYNHIRKFCSVFIFSMPSKVIIIVINFMFLGKNLFWALLRAHFNPRARARAKMSLSRAQYIFLPLDINSIVLLTHQQLPLLPAWSSHLRDSKKCMSKEQCLLWLFVWFAADLRQSFRQSCQW